MFPNVVDNGMVAQHSFGDWGFKPFMASAKRGDRHHPNKLGSYDRSQAGIAPAFVG